MTQYPDLLRLVLEHGKFKADRTGTCTYSVFGAQAQFDLRHSFPVLTAKKLHLRFMVHELLWFQQLFAGVRGGESRRRFKLGQYSLGQISHLCHNWRTA